MRPSRFFLWAMVVDIALAMAAAIIAWFFPLLLQIDWQEVIGVGVMILLYLALGLMCSVAYERGRARRLMISGIVSGAVAIAGWLALIGFHSLVIGMLFQKILVWPTCWAGLASVIGLLLLPRARGWGMLILRGLAISMSAGLALSVAGTVLFYPDWNHGPPQSSYRYDEITARIIWVFAILAAAAFLLTFLALWMQRLRGQSTTISATIPFWFECPRCGAAQNGVTGECHCQSCGLRVKVHLT